MNLILCAILFFKIVNCSLINKLKLQCDSSDNFGFEKSIAYILNTEKSETGHHFVIINHLFNGNDDNLNLLIHEIHKNEIAVINFSQMLADRTYDIIKFEKILNIN